MENNREFYERRIDELKQKAIDEDRPIVTAIQNANKTKSLKELGLINFNGTWMNIGITGGNNGKVQR